MKRQNIRLTAVIALFTLCLTLLAAPVRADGADIMIPVTVKDTGGILTADTSFRVTLERKDTDAPLPVVTEYILSPTPEDTCEFGPLLFDEPGNYRYLIRQEKHTGADSVITDQTVYEATVVVVLNESDALSASVEVRKENETQKRGSLVFANNDQRALRSNSSGSQQSAQSAENTDSANEENTLAAQIHRIFSPNTGEPLSFAPLGLLVSAGLYAVWVVRRKRQKAAASVSSSGEGGNVL